MNKLNPFGFNVEVDPTLTDDTWLMVTKRPDGTMTVSGADVSGKAATLRISPAIARRLLEQIKSL